MFVLDTNVLSEIMKPTPDLAVAGWMLRRTEDELFTAAICEAEVLYGIAKLAHGKRRVALSGAARRVLDLFAGRILPFESMAATHYADISVSRRRIGKRIDDFDAQIAAITRARGMKIVTRNASDFASTGIEIVDPWKT